MISRRPIPRSGETFGRWTILYQAPWVGKSRHFFVRCECGEERSVKMVSLTHGASKSCGCFQREQAKDIGNRVRKHGMTGTNIYDHWKHMMTRCYNKNHRRFKYWSGRGIKVVEAWHNFSNFYNDTHPTYRNGLTLDRIDNDGDYGPDNFRWTTMLEQNWNKRMQKLTREKVHEIRSRYVFGHGQRLAKEYGVCAAVISEIVNRKRNYGKRHHA